MNKINDLDFADFFNILISYKKVIILTTLISSVMVVFIAIKMPNIYQSKALLAPSNYEDEISSSSRKYSSIANIAGINIPTVPSGNQTEAIETLSSFKFFENNILPKIYLPDLMAVKSWDSKLNLLSYDPEKFDANAKIWVRKVKPPYKIKPSNQEAYNYFLKKTFSINVDKETGYVDLYIDHQSPNISKKWLDIIVSEINFILREDQKNKSMRSLEFLNEQMSLTNITEIKQGLSRLVQNEIEKLMLIESSNDYIFKVIDPPISPEIKHKPQRALICILGTLIGFVIGIIFSLALYFLNIKNLNLILRN